MEGGAWSDEEGDLWLDAELACDVKVCILPSAPHEQGNVSDPTPCAVYVPSSLLCTVPYFQASLSEPWQNESAPSLSSLREITLECTASISPSDYCNCLRFLVPEERVHMSVDKALRLLLVADHLLYQDCADVCMAYLASACWSDKEEENIQQTVLSMGLKPSSDLAGKLDSADDMKAFKEVLGRLAAKAGFGESHVAAIRDFVQAAFRDAPLEVASVCMSVIADAWTTATNDIITGSQASLAAWVALTTLLLEYGDAEKLLKDFIGVSKKVCNAMMRVLVSPSSRLIEVLSMLFLRAVSSKSKQKFVLLSNSERATLLAAWAPMVAKLNSRPLENAFKQLFTTLPLQDPILLALVKEEASSPYFEACYMWWLSKLFKRMKRCDLVHEETSPKRVKRESAE